MKPTPILSLGWLIPRIILLTFLVDIGLRLLPLPPDLFAFRAWEVVSHHPVQGGPFESNRSFHKDRAWGDLAALGNLPGLRQYHDETFTTDALGYRNPSSLLDQGPPPALLIGTSFSAGCTLNDEDTLSAQLSRATGHTIYNGALVSLSPQPIRELARRINMRRGVVICECLERLKFPPPATGADWVRQATTKASPHVVTTLRNTYLFSPLEIFAKRAYKALQNDVLLPNSYAKEVLVGRLPSGEKMLFKLKDISGPRNANPTVDYLFSLAVQLRKDDLELLVVLVPESYTVYEPLLADPPLPTAGAAYLESVESGLHNKGVAVINLTVPFRRHAALELAQGRYIYWPDDTHWNRRGVELAVAELCSAYDATTWPQGAIKRKE